jgi:hypothetical protein
MIADQIQISVVDESQVVQRPTSGTPPMTGRDALAHATEAGP